MFDIAVQEYGNAEAVFQILRDNDLRGMNDLPAGYSMPMEASFDISYPVKEGIVIEIQDTIDMENTIVANELTTVISNG